MDDVAGVFPSEKNVMRWLVVLNDSSNDKEPQEFYIEAKLVQERTQAHPEYAEAALAWPRCAERYFTAIEPQLNRLFALPRSNRFIQWVLQYLTRNFPDVYGYRQETAEATLDLLDDLYFEEISPLHIAASLGLPSLCKNLLFRGAPVNQPGSLGSPLCCALFGHAVFRLRSKPKSWTDILQLMEKTKGINSSTNLAKTVQVLVDANAECAYFLELPGDTDIDAVSLAFLAAGLAGDSGIFESILKGGAELDSNFAHLLTECFLDSESPPIFPEMLPALLACALDYTITGGDFNVFPSSVDDAALCIMDVKKKWDLEFQMSKRRRLPRLSDQDFLEVTRWFILDSSPDYLQRVVTDPRFDPNSGTGHHEDALSTLLHYAVGNNDLEIIKLVNTSTTDWSRRDSLGRTPLLRVESTEALALLVNDFHLPTTDTDKAGRNIWHYAAADNDAPLMHWLVAHDPNRSVNMNHVTLKGRTPLVEALEHIDDLRWGPRSLTRKPEPDVAHILISQDGVDCFVGDASKSLAHLAVQWGDLCILQKLYEMGVPFDSVDASGRTLLHEVSATCSLDLVKYLMERCVNPPLVTKDELTPMDTAVRNSRLSFTEDDEQSNHPVNHARLDPEVYSALLTVEAITYRDSKGHGAWERFCRVLPNHDDLEYFEHWSYTLCTCLKILNEHGVLRNYEKQSGKAAIFAVCQLLPDQERTWEKAFANFIEFAVQCSDRQMVCALLANDELLKELLGAGQADMSSYMVQLAEELGLDSAVLLSQAFLRHIMLTQDEHTLSLFLSARKHPDLRHTTAALADSLLLFLDGPLIQSPVQKLTYLINRVNIDVDFPFPEGTGHRKTTLLHRALEASDYGLAGLLAEHGADPTAGVDGDDAITALIRGEHPTMVFPLFAGHLSESEPFWQSLVHLQGSPACNRVDCAVQCHRHEMLATMLDNEGVRKAAMDAATPANQGSPAHLAALCGCRTCLDILRRHGADLGKVNDRGQTLLHVAAKMGHDDLVALLLPHINVDLADRNGKTAYDYALQQGDRVVGEFVKYWDGIRDKQLQDEQRQDVKWRDT